MAGPWEKYQKQGSTAGPWERYQTAPVQIPVPRETSFLDDAVNVAGRTARNTVEGLVSIPGMAANVMAGGYNDIADMAQGAGKGFRFPDQNLAVSNLLTKVGLPQSQGVGDEVAKSIVGVGSTAGIAQLSKSVGKYGPVLAKELTSKLGMQAATAAAGTASVVGAREAGAGPFGQSVAAVAGGALPGAIWSSPNLLQSVFRGGASPKKIQSNIQTFEALGTTPTVGQATEGRLGRGLESMLSKVLGGAGVMANKAESQAAQIGDAVDNIAGSLSSGADPTRAGQAIKQGIRGENGFVQKFKTTQELLYNNLDKYIPKDVRVDVSNTKTALSELNADIPGAPTVSKFFKNARIQGIEGALKADTEGDAGALSLADDITKELYKEFSKANNKAEAEALLANLKDGNLPYEAVKKLRTVVGRELADNTIASDVPKSKWTALYAALSDDLGSVAKTRGSEATKAWERANAYTRSGMNRIDLLSGVVDQDIPEKVYKAAISGTRDGNTTINALMKSLPKNAQKTVTATVLKGLGKATASNQNDAGDVFSMNTFLTNWNKLSPQAKWSLTGRNAYPADFSLNMDRIAKAASNLREGSKVFSNPSGTSQSLTNIGTISGFMSALFSGHLGGAALIGGTVGAANLGAKAMTNPTVVRWLAKNAEKSSSQLGNALADLVTLSRVKDDPEAADLAEQLLQQTKNVKDN